MDHLGWHKSTKICKFEMAPDRSIRCVLENRLMSIKGLSYAGLSKTLYIDASVRSKELPMSFVQGSCEHNQTVTGLIREQGIIVSSTSHGGHLCPSLCRESKSDSKLTCQCEFGNPSKPLHAKSGRSPHLDQSPSWALSRLSPQCGMRPNPNRLCHPRDQCLV